MFVARVFFQKHFSTSVGNVGVYSVCTKSVYQKWQFIKTKCFVGILQEGFTRETLAKTSCLHPVLTLRIPVMCMVHSSFCEMLSRELPAKTLQSSIAWVFTHTLSLIQPLQLNPTINTEYNRLNKIIIKFDMELKPTKHIIVNYNFTMCTIYWLWDFNLEVCTWF